jgi:hypothetical protein
MRLVGRTSSLDEFVEHKQIQYGGAPERHPLYFEPRLPGGARKLGQLWLPKPRSTRDAIVSSWRSSIENEDSRIGEIVRTAKSGVRFEDALAEAPDALGDQAFIAEFILEHARKRIRQSGDVSRQLGPLDRFIAQEYLRSNLEDLDAVILRDVGLVGDDLLPPEATAISVIRFWKICRSIGLEEAILKLLAERDAHPLLVLKEMPVWQAAASDFSARCIKSDSPFGKAEVVLLRKVFNQADSPAQSFEEMERYLYAYVERLATMDPDLGDELTRRIDAGGDIVFEGSTLIAGRDINIIRGGGLAGGE